MNEDHAWFAGFFEGEGNVRLSSRRTGNHQRAYGSPALDICQVNKEPLEKVLQLFPFGHLYGPYQYKSNRQPHYKFMITGRDRVELVYRIIFPLLSAKRRAQFRDTFAAHDKLVNRPRLKTGPKPKSEAA